MSNESVFQLKVNGKELGMVSGKNNTSKEEFINFVKGLKPDFNEAKDILEIIKTYKELPGIVLRHKARETSKHNAYVDQIINRHIDNLVSTYGKDRLFKVLFDSHRLQTIKTKAS